MEWPPAARPLACARGAAGRQTTFGRPRRGMAHHGWFLTAPRLRRCPGRSSYRCPVAGGLTRERQIRLMAGEIDRIRSGRAPDELVRLAGSLELIHHDTKAELVRCFCDTAVTLA